MPEALQLTPYEQPEPLDLTPYAPDMPEDIRRRMTDPMLIEGTQPAPTSSMERAGRNFYQAKATGIPDRDAGKQSTLADYTTPFFDFAKKFGLDPQTIADAVDTAALNLAVSEGAITPEEHQKWLAAPSRAPSQVEKAAAGTQKAVLDATSFFTSPLGVATLGTGALPAAAQRTIAGAFALHMASQVPEQVQQIGAAWDNEDTEALARGVTGLGLSGVFIQQAGKHALRTNKRAMAEALAQQLKTAELPTGPLRIGSDGAPMVETIPDNIIPGTAQHYEWLLSRLQELGRPKAQEPISKAQEAPMPEAPKVEPAAGGGEVAEGKPQAPIPKPQEIPKPLEPSQPVVDKPEAKAERPPAAGAGTITGSNEGKASAMPAEAGETPARAPVARRKLRSEEDRPPDLIDDLLTVGKFKLSTLKDEDPTWRPTGAARQLFSESAKMALDQGLQALHAEGKWLNLDSTSAMRAGLDAAVQNRKARRGQFYREEKLVDTLAQQHETFVRDARTKGKTKEGIIADELLPGEEFLLKGAKFRVKDFEFDDNGEVAAVILDDGARYGTQIVQGKTTIQIDKGSKTKGISKPNVDFLDPEPKPGFKLEKPESVEEQKARLAKEAEKAQAEARRIELERRTAKPIVGSTGDLGQGDLLDANKGDLFSAPTPQRSSAVGMPAPPPGTPTGTHQGGRMTVTMEPILPGKITVPEVIGKLESVIQAIGGTAPIREGRFFGNMSGVFKPFAEVIRNRSIDNIPTAAHEVAHALSKILFGDWKSNPLIRAIRSTPGYQPAIAELRALGKALYGSTKPAAGYTAEGFSELVRLWLTTEDAATRAPRANAWLETEVFGKWPQLKTSMVAAREAIDLWRGQGAAKRAATVPPPGIVERMKRFAAENFTRQKWIERADPLERLALGFTAKTGAKLRPSEDPFLIFTARRHTAGKVMDTMVERGMVDVWGNIVGPSLREAVAPIKPAQAADLVQYLQARRAIERWSKGKNPGMTLEDAQYLKTKLERPEFVTAAQKWYDWWDGLLEYFKQAAPEVNGPLVEAIRAGSKDYVPLARVLDPALVKGSSAGMPNNSLLRMHGSSKPVRDILNTSLLVAEGIIAKAHKAQVLEAVYRLSQFEGMGWLVEKVPRARVMEKVNFEKIREQLETMGVDTRNVPPDSLLDFASLADHPAGTDPILVRRLGNGQKEWYQVPARVYDLLAGLNMPQVHSTLARVLAVMPAKAFKLGVTGIRASFNLFTNPARDLPAYLMQTVTGNPARAALDYLGALRQIVTAGIAGESEAVKAFHQLGIGTGSFVGGDVRHAAREAKALFRGKVFRRVASPIETLRDTLSFMEAVPRLAEMERVGRMYGWEPGKPLTPDAAIAMAVAGKRATTDFSAAGEFADSWLLQAMPFFRATVSGTRSFARAFKRDQGVTDKPYAAARAVLWGLGLFTLPTLYNWWSNKDKDWYRQLPWRERYLYSNVDAGNGTVVQVPRPPEWGNAFMVIPEMLADLWYTQDPRGAGEALKFMFDTQNPLDYPVLLKNAKEQWQNRIDFFDRPIVPRNQVDLPPGQQRADYSSVLAKALGDAFPNTVSPRRVDALIRGLGGGVASDVMSAPGEVLKALGIEARKVEPQLADLPIFGRAFRRGGAVSAQNQLLADFWDASMRLDAQANGERAKMKAGQPADNSLIASAMILETYRDSVKALVSLAESAYQISDRQKLYGAAAKLAEQGLTIQRNAQTRMKARN